MNVDSSYFLDPKVNAYVQTLGFTGVERSSGSPITIGGVSIQTPTGNGTNSSYWNNLLATQVAQALGESTKFGNFVIDVKDNTVILISPPTAGSEKLELIKGSNSSIGMTVNAPSGWVNGVWYGENPWSSFVGSTYFSPSLVPVNVYSFGFTGGEQSNGSNVTVAGVSFTTPVANTSDTGIWNNEIARLHADALNSSDIYGTHAVDVSQNTSILITPRSFSDERVTLNSGQNSSIGVSLNMPSGWSGGTWLGENSWSSFFPLDTSISALVPTYALNAAASSVIEGGVALFNLSTTNVAAGTGVNYLISGVSEADVVGGVLSGSAIIDTNGRATILVPIAADSLTEGTETLRVIVSDKTATMSIADTSVASTTTNTTNITNNITNNVTNNSNTTTNINSGNTTNNFINSFNRTLKVFDVNVTNDTKVVVTRVGDITRIEGNQENNTLVGTDAIDLVLGGGGSDRFYSSKGNDVIDGGDGTDAVTFKGRSSDFRVEKVGGNWLVRDTRTDANVNQGEDTLNGVERVGFEDKVLALDTDGVAGKAYRVYKAAFNRDPMQGDTSGLGFWIDKMDNAMDLIEVSARFVDSDEFRTLYGTNPTNAQFLTKLYQNVLGRDPEASGYNWWLNELNTNPSKTKAKVLADFAESGENQAGVASLIGSGITYEPWVG